MASNVPDQLEDLLTCQLCFEKFDLNEREPKLIDCGHTYCLACLNKHVKRAGGAGRTCPQCRKPFKDAPFFLLKNFQISTVLESAASASGPPPAAPSAVSQRFFCRGCDADATDLCLMFGHEVDDKASVVLKRAKEAKLQAQRQFKREAAMLKELSESWEAMKTAITNKGGLTSRVHRELDEFKAQKEDLDKTSQLVEKVPLTSFQDNGDLPRALDRFLKDNSKRLFDLEEQKRMLELAKKCTVTVTSSADGGPDQNLAWGASLSLQENSPAEERVLVYLVYLILQNQQRRQMEAGPEASTEAGDAGSPSAPGLPGGGGGEQASWTAKTAPRATLNTLIANVKRCVLEGEGPDDDEDDDDDDDDDSDASSVVSDVSTVPDNCKNAKKVFVGRIPATARPEEIKDIFAKFGKVIYVRFLNHAKSQKAKQAPGKAKPPKTLCALVFVPDDATVENILRNTPIAYQKKGQIQRYPLNVQEDKTQKREAKVEAKRQRKQTKREGKQDAKAQAPAASSGGSQSNDYKDSAKTVFVNQVPVEVEESQLKARFSSYGDVADVVKRRHGVGNKCMAFVTFKDEKSVQRTLKDRPIKYFGNGYEDGFDLQVREFRTRAAPTPARPMIPPGLSLSETMATAAALSSMALSSSILSNLQQQQANVGAAPGPRQQQPHPQHNRGPKGQQQQPRQQQQQEKQQPQQKPQKQQKGDGEAKQQQKQPQQTQQQNQKQPKGPPKSKDEENCCVM